MKKQFTVYSEQFTEGMRVCFGFLLSTVNRQRSTRAFTLIETLVAVSLLSVAIVSPMTLTMRSLSAAYYARDQIAAFHLAQEAIEAIRHRRDANVLRIALGEQGVDLLESFEGLTDGEPFIVDTIDDEIEACEGECEPLRTDGYLYGYGGSGWTDTKYTRTVRAEAINEDEVRILVTVSWQTANFQTRNVEIYENLYRWVSDATEL